MKILELDIFDQAEKEQIQAKLKQVKEEPQKLAVTATYTAEPIAEYVKWWSKRFGEDLTVEFAPYNQVFQQLLDPTSLIAANDGINLILVRFEDWIRNDSSPDHIKCELLEQSFQELTTLIDKLPGKVPYFIGVFPVNDSITASDLIIDKLTDLQQRWTNCLNKNEKVYLIDFTEIARLYNIRQIYDPVKDQIGHLPFSDEYYAAMGTAVARAILAWKKQVFKAIVLDCDNTLWYGVCGEEGPEKVTVDGPFQFLQQFLLQKYEQGFLLALCSKNNEADVWEVFEKNPGMLLKKEHLAAWRINWEAKSQNLAELASELNIGLDSLIYIDDSPVECAEVMTSQPSVLTLQLPEDHYQITDFLRHIWALDRLKVTREDTQRTEMYLAEKRRKEIQQQVPSLDDFLRSLEIKMSFYEAAESQLPRVAQLTQRTNQFNLSTIRRTVEELRELLAEPGVKCHVIEVKDRFGEYGLVGAVITRLQGLELTIDTFLLSCRVLGRKVEDAILIELKKYGLAHQLEGLAATYHPTAKSKPFREFLERSGWKLGEESETAKHYRMAFAEIPDNIECIGIYDVGVEPKIQDTPVKADIKSGTIKAANRVDPKEPTLANEWEVFGKNGVTEHSAFLLALAVYNGQKLLQLPVHQFNTIQMTRPEYIAPRNQAEEKLVQLWQEILRIEPIGIHDHFFKLGGDSLKATFLASRIYKIFNTEVPLQEIFENPVIESLAKYLDQSGEREYCTIQPAEIKEYYPLSSSQKRLYLLNLLENSGVHYNIPVVVLIEGKLDQGKGEKIFQKLIQRHEALRTSFTMIEGKPVQQIQSEIDFKIDYYEAGEAEIRSLVKELIKPFDLNKAPLLRVSLIKIGAERHVLIYDMHHIISDGTSMGLFVEEFVRLYQSEELPPLRIQYKDFAVWQNNQLGSEEGKKQEGYWLERFRGEIPVLNLPVDFPRPSVQSFEGADFRFELSRELTEKLVNLGTNSSATLYMLLLAAYNILLMKYTGQEDIIIGSPIAGRHRHTDLEKIIGMFVNTLALRNYPEGNKTFAQFLQEVKENALKAYENQDYQFEELIGRLDLKRDLSRNPLFDTMLILQNTVRQEIAVEGLKFKPFHHELGISKFDLTLNAVETSNGIQFEMEYCTKLFKPETIMRMAGHFLNLLEVIGKNSDIRLKDIEIVTKAETEQLLKVFNNTKAEYPKDKTIHQLIEEQVERTPDNIAVVFEEQQLSYRQLNERANQLARVLREKGVRSNEIVGIMVQRSIQMIIGIIAVLKAGGAYLPLDPDYPKERIGFMLENSGAQVLLTENTLFGTIRFTGTVIDLYDPGVYVSDGSNFPVINHPSDLAYVIYTSGSTGKPKGVMIEHRAVVNFIQGITAKINFSGNKTIISVTTISFDIFVLETLLPLSKGIKIVIASEKQQIDPVELHAVILRNNINMLQTTPSRIRMLLSNENTAECLENLTEIMVGGEALSKTLIQQMKQVCRGKIYNMYGPTETTVWSTLQEIARDDQIDIGKPVNNTQIFILNQYNQLNPVGVAGELCISGEGLARGYFENLELTAERFVPNPFLPGEKMYRTGDLARWLPDGNLEFLGRIDHQVKIRGYRIEMGEIENQLLKHEFIREAIVVAKEDNTDNKYLCAYIVADKDLTVPELRDYLAQELPDYMIPSYFIMLKEMPLTPNGKIDRKALPDPDGSINTGVEYVAPATEMEAKLAGIWQEVLEVERVGTRDNFFDLGGQSLKAAQIVEKAKQQGIDISVKDIFSWTTISKICATSGRDLPTDPTPEQKEYKHFYNLEDSMQFEIDEKESKVLRIKAHNVITTYLNHALPLCVILADQRLLPWYYQHYINIFSIVGDDGFLKVEFLEYRAPYKEVMHEVYLGYNLLKNEPDIIDFVIDKISAGYYVIIHADEYYLSAKSRYQKEHFVHHSIVYGYDNNAGKLLAIGFNAEDIFTKISFEYEQFREAYEEGKKYYRESAPWAENHAVELLKLKNYPQEYPFDLERFLNALDEYIFSRGDDSIIFTYMMKKENVKYGLDVYDEVMEHIGNILKGQFTIDYRMAHLLAEHKKGIHQRLEYICSKYSLPQEYVQKVTEYSLIVEQIESIRIKFLGMNYSAGEINFEKLSNIIKETLAIIQSAKESEKRILSEISKRLRLITNKYTKIL